MSRIEQFLGWVTCAVHHAASHNTMIVNTIAATSSALMVALVTVINVATRAIIVVPTENIFSVCRVR